MKTPSGSYMKAARRTWFFRKYIRGVDGIKCLDGQNAEGYSEHNLKAKLKLNGQLWIFIHQ